ncbi:SOS response-associated peptidase [Rheinheimera muenzenbergensis]|uniref:Abasic site processing protein n=1 Tax=Rheinheimera muenzenbergensis TaxID=1193628 RepID=A0ABU8C779_9GAMM
MCGRLNVTDDPDVIALCEGLQLELFSTPLIVNRFIRATQPLSIIRQSHGQRRMDSAIWWLLLEPTAQGFSPSKYTSFNTRYDKLNVKGSAGYLPYRHSRCVIPVKGFGESEYVNGKALHYHDLTAKHGGLLLGGLYREWLNRQTGETALSCSIITLPPHAKLSAIHSKSMPLILPQDSALINAWLDETNNNTDMFTTLLKPHLPQTLVAQQIDKPSTYLPLSAGFDIEKDD